MLRIRTILVPTDFSDFSEYAWHVACALANDHGARLALAHVKAVPVVGYAGIGVPPEPVDEGALRANLNEVQPVHPNLTVDRYVLSGEPADAIVEFANEVAADMIVMGSHGRTGFGRLLMGSVAELVARRSNCPVLIVKQPMEAVEEEFATQREPVMAGP